jgi:hypothetical protein
MPSDPQLFPHRHRNGVCRRELLQVGFLGAVGASLPGLLGAAQASTPRRSSGGRAKSVILVWMPGGPPQMALWDLKPDSPAECRGSATPIRSSAAGVDVGHWIPRIAKQMHHCSIVRTITMGKEDENHIPGQLLMLAGVDQRPPNFKFFANRGDWPSVGALVQCLRPSSLPVPSAVHLPMRVKVGGEPIPGETAGWMGGRFDPWIVDADPAKADFRAPDLAPLPGLTVSRTDHRQRLLAQVDAHRRDLEQELGGRLFDEAQGRAFDIITSSNTRRAFDLAQETTAMRDRYGRHTWGQSLLMGRRLVEAGVKLVQVNLVAPSGSVNTWDYHQVEDASMKVHMPIFDQGFSALLEDLFQRGLLDETLVVCASEMGRNPVMGKTVSGAAVNASTPDGRNHWQFCWSVVFAGAGVRGGTVVGKSDEWAGYPDGEAYYPSDFASTILDALGITGVQEVRDLLDRPMYVNEGRPIRKLYTGSA